MKKVVTFFFFFLVLWGVYILTLVREEAERRVKIVENSLV